MMDMKMNNEIEDGMMPLDELMWHLQFLTEEQREKIFHQIGNNVTQKTPFLYKSKIEWPNPMKELRMEVWEDKQ